MDICEKIWNEIKYDYMKISKKYEDKLYKYYENNGAAKYIIYNYLYNNPQKALFNYNIKSLIEFRNPIIYDFLMKYGNKPKISNLYYKITNILYHCGILYF